MFLSLIRLNGLSSGRKSMDVEVQLGGLGKGAVKQRNTAKQNKQTE
jgi:hypothetical protein